MTKTQQEPRGFLNNAIIGLALLFTVPALLTVGGVWLVAQQEQIPGGTETACERTLTETVVIRIEQYTYQAGLTPYEQQRFFHSQDGGTTWTLLFDDTVQAPRGLNCDDNIRVLDDGSYLLFNRKHIALSSDGGASWQTHYVCDAPRPTEERCDEEAVDFAAIEFVDGQRGNLLVQRLVVDEYGMPLSENGEPLVTSSYTLSTQDGGEHWNITSVEE